MADFLNEKLKEIDGRLGELQPLIDEFNRLQAARSALAGVAGNGASRPAATTSRTTTRRRRATAGRRRASTARARTRGEGTRSAQAFELVRSKPGITIPELAASMGIKQNYLYRVLPGLEKDKQVRKEGRGWFPVG
jgi:hypothetical protein